MQIPKQNTLPLLSPRLALGVLILVLFIGRLWYATGTFGALDSFQVYLIGLKSYLTGVYPYWGADVVYTESRIPGGLQGLLVGLPFHVVAAPESPYIFLQLLSLGCIALFVKYLRIRFPEIPSWFTWIWILTTPWMVYYTTRIENPSYVIPMAMLFFMAVWELLPFYPKRIIRPEWSFFTLGFGLIWIFQLHLSWVLLIPYIVVAFLVNARSWLALASFAGCFLLGITIGGIPLWPTFWKFGALSLGGTEQNISLNPDNAKRIFLIVSRIFSFGAYETARFMGGDTAGRILFLQKYLWAAPAVILVSIVGLAQVGLFIGSLFRSKVYPEWSKVRLFMLMSILFVYGGFLFSVPQPYSHAYVVLLPVVIWYSFYCYGSLAAKRWFRPVSILILSAGIVSQIAFAIEQRTRYGLDAYRADFEGAFQAKDYTYVGLRREARFERQHFSPLWTCTTVGDSVRFTSGFECSEPWFMPQNIVQYLAFSGLYCAKLDSIQPYSPILEIPVWQLGKHRQLHLSFALKQTHPQDLTLVTTAQSGQAKPYWAGTPIITPNESLNQWNTLNFNIQLPDSLDSLANLELYLWRPSASRGSAVYWDEVEVAFRR